MQGALAIMPIKRERGRPKGQSLESKQCPHGHNECLGPVSLRETVAGIIRHLEKHDVSGLYAPAVESKLWAALGWLGLGKAENTVMFNQSPCPYGLSGCTTPERAIERLLEVHLLLVRAEQSVVAETGEFITLGDTSSIYLLSRIFHSLGHHNIADGILQMTRERFRQFQLNNNPTGGR